MISLLKLVKSLPTTPGVYLFYNSKKELIYVGKATSLRARVSSYLRSPKSARPIEQMMHEVKNIKTISTDSVLEAVILEGKYIKEKQPRYNIDWRDDKSWNYIAITKDEYPKVITVREHDLNSAQNLKNNKLGYKVFFGPFPGLNTTASLKILRKIFKFSLCKPNSRECLYHQMGECLGVCTGEISPSDYEKKVIRPLVLFLSGKKKFLLSFLKKEMVRASKKNDFEEAGRLRDQIKALQKIQDTALLNKDFFQIKENLESADFIPSDFRVEAYDISNLGKTGKVGSMVVFRRFGAVKSDYRKFKIKTVIGQSDVDCLAEVLTRRLKHKEWQLPDLFLIDGGAPQVNTVLKILRVLNIKRPVLGIAKGVKRDRNDFIFANTFKYLPEFIKEHRNLLIQARDEAHRFAIAFNREQRKIK